MMKIILYVNRAENERVNKTDYLEKVAEVEGYLRAPSSILTPSIAFELPNQTASSVIDEDDEDIASPDADVVVDSTLFYSFNYAYIEDFGRFYYMQDVIIERSHIFNCALVVDTLMSFKDAVLGLDAFVDRNEFTYSQMLEDNMIPFEFEKEITDVDNLDGGSLVNTRFVSTFGFYDPNIVISVITDISFSTASSVTAPTGTGLNDIRCDNFQSPDAIYCIDANAYDSINDKMMGDEGRYSSFVKSVIALPYIPRHDDAKWTIKVGKNADDLSLNVKGYEMPLMSDYVVVADFVADALQDFYDLPPYANYEMFIPFLGWINVNYLDIAQSRIIVYYAVSYSDGSATAYVYNVTKKRVVYSSPCQLGVKISLNTTNNYELKTQQQALGLNLAVGLISSALSVGAGVATSNPVAVLGGAIGTGKSIVNFVNSNARLFERASSSYSDSASGLYSSLKVHLRKTRMTPRWTLNMQDYAHQVGRPLRAVRRLSDLEGFTIVSSIHLENLNAFKKEKEDIERALKSGVIL